MKKIMRIILSTWKKLKSAESPTTPKR